MSQKSREKLRELFEKVRVSAVFLLVFRDLGGFFGVSRKAQF